MVSLVWLHDSFRVLIWALIRNVLWDEKTSNKKGCVVEIFRLDNSGR